MRCKASGFAQYKIRRAAQEILRRRADAVLHALHCRRCGVRGEAEALLRLAGRTEDEWIDELWEALCADSAEA